MYKYNQKKNIIIKQYKNKRKRTFNQKRKQITRFLTKLPIKKQKKKNKKNLYCMIFNLI